MLQNFFLPSAIESLMNRLEFLFVRFTFFSEMHLSKPTRCKDFCRNIFWSNFRLSKALVQMKTSIKGLNWQRKSSRGTPTSRFFSWWRQHNISDEHFVFAGWNLRIWQNQTIFIWYKNVRFFFTWIIFWQNKNSIKVLICKVKSLLFIGDHSVSIFLWIEKQNSEEFSPKNVMAEYR